MNYHISDKIKAVDGDAIEAIFRAGADPNVISLAGGNPAPELFPGAEMAQLAQEILWQDPVLALQYHVTAGYQPLREALQRRLKEKEGIGQAFDRCIILSGGQQGIDLIAKTLLNPGDTVLVEEPSYLGALNIFRAHSATLRGIPMEADGMDLDALERTLESTENVRLLYTIPTFQNPAGATMSLEKRKRLYALSKKYQLVILEDNPYGELAFDGIRPPTLKSLDTQGLVIYCGSFSKILSPGLRLGYLVAHEDLLNKVLVAKQCADVHTPMLTQLLAYRYMEQYGLDAGIEQMRKLYRHRCQVMLDAMKEYLPSYVTYVPPRGGLFIWCDLHGGRDALEVSRVCAKNNVAFVPGNVFMTDLNQPCSALRLNYSTMSDERIRAGIEILGRVLKTLE